MIPTPTAHPSPYLHSVDENIGLVATFPLMLKNRLKGLGFVKVMKQCSFSFHSSYFNVTVHSITYTVGFGASSHSVNTQLTRFINLLNELAYII